MTRALILVWLVSLASANMEIKTDQCVDLCEYNDTKNVYEMDCRERGCTSIPEFEIFGLLGFHKATYYMITLILKGSAINTVAKIKTYPYLDNLDLSYCQINTIDNGAFDNCSLKVLNLAHNQIGDLGFEQFKGLESLEQLDLSNNALHMIRDNVFFVHLKNLVRLDLSDNSIKNITPNAFTDLHALKYLHLENNLLYNIDSKEFLGLEMLQALHLQGNRIQELSNATFIECSSLEVLDLHGNMISSIEPHAFLGLEKLTVLHLRGNRLTEFCAAVFTPLVALQSIYLNENPITSIAPGTFPPSLQKISMQNMTEMRIIANGTFSNLPSLHTVEITDSKNLVQIDEGAFAQQNSTITGLNLYNNSLKTLYENLVNWSMISTMNLAENRWICDCEMAWVKHSPHIPQTVKHSIRCYAPYHLSGKAISEVDFEAFSCAFYDVNRGGIEFGILFFITTLFLAAAGILMYIFRYTVFPCFFKKPGKYTTMYDAVNTEEDESVEIQWKKEKTEQIIPGPTPV